MNLLFSIVFGLVLSLGHEKRANPAVEQIVRWDSAAAWTLYDITDRRAPSYSLDTLANFRSIMLNADTMKFFLSGTRSLTKKSPIWMGYYVASCKLASGERRKILISMYGGFFLDQKTGEYYELPETVRKDWLEYLSETYVLMQTKSS